MKIVTQAVRRLAKIPGAMELAVKLSDLVGRPPRVDTSWRHLERWLEELEASPSVEGGSTAVPDPILFYAVYPQWIDYSLAIATLLVGRGVPVDFWWQGEMTPLAERPALVRETFWRRHARRHSTTAHHPRLSLSNLDQVTPVEATDLMRSCAEEQAKIDVSYLLLKERIDIDGDARDRMVFEERRKRNLDVLCRIAAAYGRRRFSRILLGSGGMLEFGSVYRYFQALGAQVTTFESVDIKSRIWVSHGESVVRIDTSAMWQSDEPHAVTPERRERVLKIMQTRQTPGSSHLVIPYQKATPGSADSTRKSLRLVPDKPVILVCPNVPFDAVFYSGGRQVFAGMWEWLVETCRYLADRPECQVVIRCHPAEPYYDTRETTSALLKEHLPKIPDHFRIVAPTDDISTYSIMEISDLGIVFASTTGLEMALRGISVVCGNPSQHYNRKGFTIDAPSRQEYFAAVDRIIRNPRSGRLTSRQAELACCYADLYFNQWYRQFPWQAQSLWEDVRIWPIQRVLSAEGVQKFGGVLDELIHGPAGSNGHPPA